MVWNWSYCYKVPRIVAWFDGNSTQAERTLPWFYYCLLHFSDGTTYSETCLINRIYLGRKKKQKKLIIGRTYLRHLGTSQYNPTYKYAPILCPFPCKRKWKQIVTTYLLVVTGSFGIQLLPQMAFRNKCDKTLPTYITKI